MGSLKNNAFQYLMFRLIEWYKESYKTSSQPNDLSVLKSLKLLFFVSAVDTKIDKKNTLLDNNLFDKFVAMPFGHVESEIYTSIKNNEFEQVEITNKLTTLKGNIEDLKTPKHIADLIDSSINSLKKINPRLINSSAFDLVELSHSWYSWKFYYKKATNASKHRESIPVKVIKSEVKNFHLS